MSQENKSFYNSVLFDDDFLAEETHQENDEVEVDENFFYEIDEKVYRKYYEATLAHRTMCDGIKEIPYELEDSLDASINLVAECEILREKINYNEPIDYIYDEVDDSLFQESGDDYISASRNPMIAVAETVIAQQLFGAVLSIKDTWISSEIGMFTGKTVLMPKDSTETVARVQKEKNLKRTSPIIDIGPQRVLLPVSPQRVEQSTSLEGKMNLVARVSAYSKNTADEWYQEKASIIQDVLLGVGTRGKKFPYLPCSLGGYDKSFPFKTEKNIDRSIYWWKRGTYKGLITTIISHACKVLNPGKIPFHSSFLDHVKRMYSGWQPWYTTYQRQLPTFSGKLPPELLKYKVGHYGESFMKDMAIRRLGKEGLLITENQLVIANEVQGYVDALLSKSGIEDFKKEREKVEKQFRLDTAFSKSFSVIFNDYVNVTVVPSLSDWEKRFAMSINLENTLQVKHFLAGEQFFSAEALDHIYLKGPQKVTMPLRNGSFITSFMRISKATAEQVLGYDDAELEALYTWLLEAKGGAPPRELLEDDDVIYQEIIDSLPSNYSAGEVPSVIVVTDDIQLCKRLNREIGVVVWRIPTLFYLRFSEKESFKVLRNSGDGFEVFRSKVLEVEPNATFYGVELDTGSLSAVSMKTFRRGAIIVEEDRRTQNFTVRTPLDEKVRVTTAMLDSWPKDRFQYVFDSEELVRAFLGKGNATSWRRSIGAIADEVKAAAAKPLTVLAPPKREKVVSRVKRHAFETLNRLKQRIGLTPPDSQKRFDEGVDEVFEYKNLLLSVDEDNDSVELLVHGNSLQKSTSTSLKSMFRVFGKKKKNSSDE